MINFGHGVHLETLSPDSLDRLRTWRNDVRIRKWCRQNDLISWQHQKDWFESLKSNPSIKMYEIHAPEKSRPIGVCGLTSIEPINRRAEFSLYIAPDCQHLGYGRNSLKTLISHGMNNLGLNSIWGESFDGNPAIEMFKKLGLKMEGIKKEAYYREGQFVDAHLFSILHSQWRANPTFNKVEK